MRLIDSEFRPSKPLIPYEGPERPVIIGATGTIGRHLTRSIVESYPGPVVAISRSKSSLEKLANGYENLLTIPADATNREEIIDATRGTGLIIVTAADMSLAKQNLQTEVINRKIAQNAVAAAQEHGARIQFISSVAVYGALDTDKPVTEKTPTNPQNSYGRSKVDGEKIMQESGVPYTIFRPNNVLEYDADAWTHSMLTLFGYGVSTDKLPSLLQKMFSRHEDVKRINVNRLIDIIGNRIPFDYNIVRNTVNLMMRAANNTKASENQVFNAVDGRISLAQFAKDHTEQVIGGIFPPAPEGLKRITQGVLDAVGHLVKPKSTIAQHFLHPIPEFSGEKAVKELGYKPQIRYEQYLADTRGYVQHYGIRKSSRI